MKLPTLAAAALVAIVLTSCSSVEPGEGPLALSDTARGCAGFIVYIESTSGRDVVLTATEDSLELGMQPRTFDLASVDAGLLALRLDRFGEDGGPETYCTDVMTGLRPLETWKATSGRITITREPVITAPPQNLSHVSVVLENIRFVSPDGDTERTIERATYDDVLVGWYPG